MKHAYLIIAHNDLEQLMQLMFSLDYENNDLFIHLDAKSAIEIDTLKEIAINKARVYIYKEYDVRWGTESQVKCEIFLLKSAWRKAYYDYYHIISGADYPIKTHEQIELFFLQNAGKEFVHFDAPEAAAVTKERVCYYHPLNKFYKITPIKSIHWFFFRLDDLLVFIQKIMGIKRTIPFAKLQKGCNWCSITQDFVTYLLEYEDTILEMVKSSECADEIFVQTILINSDFADRLYCASFDNDYAQCARFIMWNEENVKYPKTLSDEDFEQIINSDAVFARKFSSGKSNSLIRKIKEYQRSLNIETG